MVRIPFLRAAPSRRYPVASDSSRTMITRMISLARKRVPFSVSRRSPTLFRRRRPIRRNPCSMRALSASSAGSETGRRAKRSSAWSATLETCSTHRARTMIGGGHIRAWGGLHPRNTPPDCAHPTTGAIGGAPFWLDEKLALRHLMRAASRRRNRFFVDARVRSLAGQRRRQAACQAARPMSALGRRQVRRRRLRPPTAAPRLQRPFRTASADRSASRPLGAAARRRSRFLRPSRRSVGSCRRFRSAQR